MFKYDPLGRRIEKVSPSITSGFACDGDILIEETNSSGTVIARYTQTAVMVSRIESPTPVR